MTIKEILAEISELSDIAAKALHAGDLDTAIECSTDVVKLNELLDELNIQATLQPQSLAA